MAAHTESFGNYANQTYHQIVSGVPKLLGALVILVIGYFVAKLLARVVDRLLAKAALDTRLHSGHGGNIIQRTFPSPSRTIAKVVFWLVFLFAISTAISVLGIPLLVGIVAGIYAYIPNVIAALLIFLVAGAVSAGVAGVVAKAMGDTATGKVVSTVAPVVIMSIAGFMILNQLKIAPAIVTITYAALMGSAALGLALAFGLGGRDVAARMLGDLHSKAQANKDVVAADVKLGQQRAKEQAEKLS